MPVIEMHDVSKTYNEVVALSRLSMHVQEGSLTGFVGPNGAGKSTSIRMITGLSRPDSGEVHVFGLNPYDNPRVHGLFGFVSEHDDLYSWASVYDSVKLLAKLNKPRESNLDKKIMESLAAVGMSKYSERKTSTLSKGMRQRTRIAAALVHEPRLLILDEPLKGLDPLGRRTIMNLLLKLNHDNGVTILISSHILEELEQLVNRITLIHRGQTIAEGSPEGIRSLVYTYPHEIIFTSNQSDMKNITSNLVQLDQVVRSIEFGPTKEEVAKCHVVTLQPDLFFDELVRISVETKSPLLSVEATSESVEKLFDYLVG
jgi:ABC-2 type transport system ATP-binding protein